MTGAEAPTEAERRHLLQRGALATFIAVLAEEPTFWRDVDAVRSSIAGIDWQESNATRITNPPWQRSLAYGVRGVAHRELIATILLVAAAEETKTAARLQLQRLGERPIPLDGEPRGRARHDVTRLVEGAGMVAAYRAGRCAVPDCGQQRQGRRGRYCRRHDGRQTIVRAHEEARLWAIDRAADALKLGEPVRLDRDYAVWLFRSRGELDG
jgi:hypothetical protein